MLESKLKILIIKISHPGIKLSLASEAELEAVKNDPMVKNNTEIKRTGKGSKVDYSSTIRLDYNTKENGKLSKSSKYLLFKNIIPLSVI